MLLRVFSVRCSPASLHPSKGTECCNMDLEYCVLESLITSLESECLLPAAVPVYEESVPHGLTRTSLSVTR